MFFKSLINTLSPNYSTFNYDNFNNVNPNLVKYFRNEYGTDWKNALEHHLYEKKVKNVKKAA